MNIVSFGAGTNSTAMLIGLKERDITPDHILFADTGGERPETYQHIKDVNEWLNKIGFPQITVAQEKHTLESDCIKRKALPGIAYGFKSCSEHYKVRPQKRWVKQNGIKDIKWIIGIDAGESHRAKDDNNWYPLIEWGWGREECISAIERVGLTQPGKSSCFFCPSMRVAEIKNLKRVHPELCQRAIQMEENAELTSISGLGRNFSWKNLLATDDMFDDPEIEIACGCYDG